MDVQLYVYDLTRGMAKALSASLLGIQLDAVYHTALVFNQIEYFYGRGIQRTYPGHTHHGQPMEIISMGTTYLPMDTITEYLESLGEVYTAESYDLFAHNCNNFTNDFSMFLVGKGIPDHITNLPKRVLDTPMGQMLKSQIDSSMREITQAPTVPPSRAQPSATNGSNKPSRVESKPTPQTGSYGQVVDVTDASSLDKHLKSATNTAATIFFTSSTCVPCTHAYPMFDQLAGQYSSALFVKVDINQARSIAANYQIRATPTFITISKGIQQDSWSGADPNLLKANVDSLILKTFPPHPHTLLRLPTLQYGSLKPVTYIKIPPLEKLVSKLGDAAKSRELMSLRSFVEQRGKDPKEAPLPDLKTVGVEFTRTFTSLPVEVRFAALDLLRCAMIDVRVGSFYAEEQPNSTVATLIQHVNELAECPHNLRLVTIHLACNLFASPLYVKALMQPGDQLSSILVHLVTSSLLDTSHPTTRVAAASLAFNIASANYRVRREEGREGLRDNDEFELAASVLETLKSESNNDASKALLLAFGYLIYCAPQQGEVFDLARAVGAEEVISGFNNHKPLVSEITSLLR